MAGIYVRTDEIRKKIGLSNKGKKRSIEAKQKNRKAHLGKIPWNKGLTSETDERVRKLGLKGAKTQLGKIGYWLNKKRSEETKNKIQKTLTKYSLINKFCQKCNKIFITKYNTQKFCSQFCSKTAPHSKERKIKMSNTMKKKFANGELTPAHRKRIYYKDKCFRSSWEVKVAQWLDIHKIEWKYESGRFPIVINNKNETYLSDFYIPILNKYIEVKAKYTQNLDKYLCWQNQYPNLSSILIQDLEIKNLDLSLVSCL